MLVTIGAYGVNSSPAYRDVARKRCRKCAPFSRKVHLGN